MELVALICTPKSPACLHCPIQQECRAFHEGVQDKLPIKQRKKKQRTVRYFVLLLKNKEGNIAIEQRPDQGLLANMWQFPMIPWTVVNEEELTQFVQRKYGIKIKVKRELGHVSHVFSHKIWDLTIMEACCLDNKPITENASLLFLTEEMLQNYPFSVSHLKVKQFI